MRIIEVVDEDDFESLAQLVQALRKQYRDALGPIPGPADDTAARADRGRVKRGRAGRGNAGEGGADS